MSGALWSFIGACLTFIVSIGAAGWVLWATPGLKKLDRALHFGLAGLIGLGALGILTFFIGLIPGALIALRYPVELIVGLGGIIAVTRPKARPKVDVPHGREWVPALIVGFAALLALMSVLAPPDTIEWDSLAYHLAVPKLWLQQGHISYIPFIHHSNFPFVFDNLYLWGLQWGGEAGAKAFVYAAAVYGGIAIFGLTRHVYSREAAWWATVAYATIPVILWLSGTAYIDVPNGLCAGLGIAMAALWVRDQDKSYLWLAAILLGLAAASKYTALQTIGAVGLVLLIIGIRRKQPARYFKSAVFVGVLAMAIASPWYIKNVLWTGNPVYPFFYGLLGGKNWSAERSKVYTHEQLTFGVGSDAETGKHDVSQFGHAVLGLGYQPGRYINPLQTSGGGNPLGAVGVVVLATMLAWAFSGKTRSFELTCLAVAGLSLVMWFFLSQQSRYIVTLAIPLCVMLGGGVARLRAGPILAVITCLQAAYTLYLEVKLLTASQLPVALGMQSRSAYLSKRVPFYDASQEINNIVPKTGKVALYDEVFGYLLDVPYFWANPGHTNVIPYEQMRNGHDFARIMRDLGFTHIYVNLSPSVRPDGRRWLAAMGLQGAPQPYSPEEGMARMSNFEQRFVPLIAEAAANHELRPVNAFKGGLLFEITPTSP